MSIKRIRKNMWWFLKITVRQIQCKKTWSWTQVTNKFLFIYVELKIISKFILKIIIKNENERQN